MWSVVVDIFSVLWEVCFPVVLLDGTVDYASLRDRLGHSHQMLVVPAVQVWSIVVGLPLCAVGGVFYSWASGQTVVEGFVNAYGALYKIPGKQAYSDLPVHAAVMLP